MALVNAVPDGAELVEITEIVNAGSFWVTANATASEKWSKSRAQLKTTELFLAKAKLTAIPKQKPPFIKELVAVNDPHTGKWHRGRVEGIPQYSDGDYQVFLIDHGRTIEVPESAIRDIDVYYTKQEALAFLIILFGIVPKEPVSSNQLGETPAWPFLANMFVKKQIARSPIGYFCQKTESVRQDVKYGELFLIVEDGFINLGFLLCKQKFAIARVDLPMERSGENRRSVFSPPTTNAAACSDHHPEFESSVAEGRNRRGSVASQRENQRRMKQNVPQKSIKPVGKELMRKMPNTVENQRKSSFKNGKEVSTNFGSTSQLSQESKLLNTQDKAFKKNYRVLSLHDVHPEEEEEGSKPSAICSTTKSLMKSYQRISEHDISESRRSDVTAAINQSRAFGRNKSSPEDKSFKCSRGFNNFDRSQGYSREKSFSAKSDLPPDYMSFDEDVPCSISSAERDVERKSLPRGTNDSNTIHSEHFETSRRYDESNRSCRFSKENKDFPKHYLLPDNEMYVKDTPSNERFHKRDVGKRSLSPDKSRGNKMQSKFVESFRRSDNLSKFQGYPREKSFSSKRDLSPHNMSFDEDTPYNISPSGRDIGRTSLSRSINDSNTIHPESFETYGRCDESSMSHEVHKESKFSAKHYIIPDSETSDKNTSKSVKFNERGVGKKPISPDKGSGHSVQPGRCFKQNRHFMQLNKSSSKWEKEVILDTEICDVDYEFCDERDLRKETVSSDTRNRNHSENFECEGSNVSIKSRGFEKKNTNCPNHDSLEDCRIIDEDTLHNKRVSEKDVANVSVFSDNDARHKIPSKSNESHKSPEEHFLSKNNETFDDDGFEERDLKTKFVPPNKISKNVESSEIEPEVHSTSQQWQQEHKYEGEHDTLWDDETFNKVAHRTRFVERDQGRKFMPAEKDSGMKTHPHDKRNKLRFSNFNQYHFPEKTRGYDRREQIFQNESECRETDLSASEIQGSIRTESHSERKSMEVPERGTYGQRTSSKYDLPEVSRELSKDSDKFSAQSTLQEHLRDTDSELSSDFEPSVKRKVKHEPIRTFFPAGFNMSVADRVFVDQIFPLTTKQKCQSVSPPKPNCTNKNVSANSVDITFRNSVRDNEQKFKFVPSETIRENQLVSENCCEQNRLQKHMNADLDEKLFHSSNTEINNRNENEGNLLTYPEVKKSDKLSKSCETEKSYLPKLDMNIGEMKSEHERQLPAVQNYKEFDISSELKTMELTKNKLKANTIEEKLVPDQSEYHMQGMQNETLFPQTSDKHKTKLTAVSPEHRLLSAIREYLAESDLAQATEINSCVSLLQQLLQNLTGISKEVGADDLKEKDNNGRGSSKISETEATDQTTMVRSVEIKEPLQESTLSVSPEMREAVISSAGPSDVQNGLHRVACETIPNVQVTVINDDLERKGFEPSEESHSTSKDISKITQGVSINAMSTVSIKPGEDQAQICKVAETQAIESLLEEISERVMLEEDPEEQVQEDLKVIAQESESTEAEEKSTGLSEEVQNVTLNESLGVIVEEGPKAMKDISNLETEENLGDGAETGRDVQDGLHIEAEEGTIDTMEKDVKVIVDEGQKTGMLGLEIMTDASDVAAEEGSMEAPIVEREVMAEDTLDVDGKEVSEILKEKDSKSKFSSVDVKECSKALADDPEVFKEERLDVCIKGGLKILTEEYVEDVDLKAKAEGDSVRETEKYPKTVAEGTGKDVVKEVTKDSMSMVENSRSAIEKNIETTLEAPYAEPVDASELVPSGREEMALPSQVSDSCETSQTNSLVITREAFQIIPTESLQGTSSDSENNAIDILDENSTLPEFSSNEHEIVSSADIKSAEVKGNIAEEAQSPVEQVASRKSRDSSADSDGKTESEKSPPHRIINVNPDPCSNLVLNSGRKIMDQLQLMIVLLHGAPEDFRHLNVVTDAAFRIDVHEVLKTIMNRLMRLQKYTWPLIQQGYSVAMVGPPTSGKTLGYAVPLLDMVMQNVHCNQIPKGNGPVLIILCSGSKSCNEIREICDQFTRTSAKDIKVLVAYGGGAEKGIEFKLINGCHILITTPCCFKRLLTLGKVVVNFLRLKYFVLDEADVLTLRFLPEVEFICKSVERDMKPQDKAHLQVVAAAEKWCPGMEGLVRSLSKPVVCIGAFIEALIYAHLKPQVHFVMQSSKIAIVKDIITKSAGNHRTLIVCQKATEVETVNEALKPYRQLLFAHDNMDTCDIHEVYVKWSWMDRPVLVCTDIILQEMRIQGASQLVHFDLGSITKRMFALRCSALIELLPSMFGNQKQEETRAQPQMHIFISDSDCEPLPTLVSFLKRLNIPVDPDLQKRANAAEVAKEMRRDCVPLCYNTKAFGDCWNRSKCVYRHVISSKDKPRNIPVSGTVKVKILYIHDTCNFSARLLEHVNENGTIEAIPNHVMSLTRKLHLYFKKEEHRILLENPRAHDICASEKPPGVFHRTEILAVTKADRFGRATQLLVRFIDDGCRDLVNADKVFVLPEDLKDIPPQSVELYLCRLVPCDLDWSWGTVTNNKVINILSKAQGKGRFLVGKIKLSLGHMLWLDPLECFESLPTLKTSTIIFSLRRKLLDEKLAVENPQHLQLLYQACERGGLKVACTATSDASLQIVKTEEKEEINWAYLPVDEFSLVYFIVGDHPGRFYMRQKKFEDLVHKLDKKLVKFVKEKGTTDRTLFTGDYCIGRFPTDDRWYRARVEKAQDDNLDLFFVDHGDRATVSRSEAIPLPKNFISQLPFQALECCFAGVTPDLGDRWSEKSIDALYGITAKPGTAEGVKLLYAKVMKKEKPADCTGGYKYHVALVEVTPHGRALLNDTLVAWGLGFKSEEQKQHLKALDFSHLVSPVELDDYESDEDDCNEAGEACSLKDVEISFEESSDSTTLSPQTRDPNASAQSYSSDVSSKSDASLVSAMFSNFNFDEITENEIMEFFEKAMENYKNQEGKNSSVNIAFSTEGKNREEEKGLKEAAPDLHKTPSGSKKALEKETECVKREPVNICDYSDSSRDDMEDLNSTVNDDSLMPLLQRTTRVPLIFWHQSAHFVWLRVDLPGVEKYHLKWNTQNLHFWTMVEDLVYTFDLNLFGPIDPNSLTHSGGLFVRIKMHKVAVGMDWLRLIVEPKKLPWIKCDYNAENDSDIEDLHLSEQLRAVKEMEKKTAARIHSGGLLPADEVPYENDNDNDDSDSSCSDVVLPGDEQYDPYDPMN